MTGQWIGWNGGDCPVDPRTTVEYMMQGGDKSIDLAQDLDWQNEDALNAWNIICYRVVKEYREPREVWLMWDDAGYMYFCGESDHGAVHFREAIE